MEFSESWEARLKCTAVISSRMKYEHYGTTTAYQHYRYRISYTIIIISEEHSSKNIFTTNKSPITTVPGTPEMKFITIAVWSISRIQMIPIQRISIPDLFLMALTPTWYMIWNSGFKFQTCAAHIRSPFGGLWRADPYVVTWNIWARVKFLTSRKVNILRMRCTLHNLQDRRE